MSDRVRPQIASDNADRLSVVSQAEMRQLA